MKIETALDKLHKKATANRWLQIFTAFTRVLLAVGFIPPSIPKILHKPFTVLPDSNPVGHYFNALYNTGFYYEFIGWTQITAAILLLFPRTAHIGSLMFFPVILNIAVLTNSVGFAGTWLVTILMVLAASYLVAWDYDRLKPILFGKRKYYSSFLKYEFIWLPLLFGFGGISVTVLAVYAGIANLHKSSWTVYAFLIAFSFVFGLIVTIHHKFMSAGELKNPAENLFE